jgi:glucose-1-phosphate adenylyltransferase
MGNMSPMRAGTGGAPGVATYRAAAGGHTSFIGALSRKTYAMVLAGGRGSRLMQLTNWRAKPAVPFAGTLRIVDFPLSNCINSGIRRVSVLTQYKAQSLIGHIERGWGFLESALNEFIDVVPAQQRVGDDWYRGTADAVYQNLDILREADPEYVLVLAGDHVYKMDYGVMLAEHIESSADITIACIEAPIEQASAFGVMEVDAMDRVVAFAEKPKRPKCIPGQPGAGEHGHLHLQREVPVRGTPARRDRCPVEPRFRPQRDPERARPCARARAPLLALLREHGR